jgi:putative transposase
MPRTARIVIPGVPHHVTQRGDHRMTIFHNDDDYQKFLQMLYEYANKHGLKILSYCLMPNHIHIICIPITETTLEEVFKPLLMRYAQYRNRTQRTSGHVWQQRFYSCPMDVPHLWTGMRYAERNPIRAGLVSRAEDYPWSSAAAHCGLRKDPLLSAVPESYLLGVPDWSAWLAEPEDSLLLKKIRKNTLIGRPLGNDHFIQDLENRLGQRIKSWHVGEKRGR